jgi:hypothetical protein
VSAYRQMTDLTSFRLVLDDQNTLWNVEKCIRSLPW